MLMCVCLAVGQTMNSLVDCSWLCEQIKNGKTQPGNGLKILDCHFKPVPKPDPEEFRKEYFGNLETLTERPSQYKHEYNTEHLPFAIFFDLQVAMFPAKQIRLELNAPKFFHRYIAQLGVNKNDHIVLYDRSNLMVFAAKTWWLLKSHGYDNVSVLDGGFNEWKKLGYETTSEIPKYPAGNPLNSYSDSMAIRFMKLFGENGVYFNERNKFNLLDVRPEDMFTGATNLSFPKSVTGSRIPGFTNIPVDDFLDNGKLKTPEQINNLLSSCSDFDITKETILMCTTGTKTSLVHFALYYWNKEHSVKMYNGSLTEVSLRAPELITERGKQ